MIFQITTDDNKIIKAIKGDDFKELGYEEKEILGNNVKSFLSEEDKVSELFSKAEQDQLNERGFLKSLPKKILSKESGAIPIDLGVEIESFQGRPKSDLVFTIQKKDESFKKEILLKLQNVALEKLATGKSLKEIFDSLTKGAEREVNCAKASILILNNTETRLLDGSTPSFSEEVRGAFNGMVIGPLEGSCGTAVYNKKLTIVEDISTDPRWEKFKDFAHANGLKACTSSPIMSSDGRVLGSFALTFTQAKAPTDFELEIIKTLSRIASLAIEKNKSEENIERYAEELMQSNQELKNFAFSASHDLKEPLRTINLFAKRLLEQNLSTENREDLIQRIQKSSSRMYQLTDSLYNWASIGPMDITFKRENLNEVLQEVIDDLSGSIQETDAKIKIENLPELEFEKIQFRQLFQNLISNAMKFHRKGIAPEINISSHCTGDGYCEIEIKDNGIGIDPKYHQKIFEPFSRLNNKREYPGSGIGLAICEKIVLQHHGEIKIVSSPELGTKITLRLPSQQIKG